MFDAVSSRVSFPDLDAETLQYWKDRDVFRRSVDERPDAPLFMMYEGPPTANGSPGIHHVLARVFKDVICRYRTMKGCRVPRKGGWDTHGLPVEMAVEQELGLSSKRDIEEYGIAEFNRHCRESVFRYVKDWEVMTDRIGFWVDMENPYVTLENDYIESGWWILKQLWEQGLLYEDRRGTPHCPRCVSSLSSHEVALGYRENTPDPSVFVQFKVLFPPDGVSPAVDTYRLAEHRVFMRSLQCSDDEAPVTPVYLLAWTTTPWTLPGNTALAVNPDAEYSVVATTNNLGEPVRLILATRLRSALHGHYDVLDTFPGARLVDIPYRPLYDATEYGVPIRQFARRPGPGGSSIVELEDAEGYAPKVVAADFVSMDDGSGIVHIAPAFGDEDLALGREQELAFIQQVDLQGIITGDYPFAGKFVKDADGEIAADLAARGLLYHRTTYRHTYPFCWRCDTPLLYYAKTSWYIRTTARKDRLVGLNSGINWYPDHIREGRFGEWLRNNVDWAISRERYWGTPIPIWRCDRCDAMECIGSVAELGARSGQDVSGLDLHRPYVDEVAFPCRADGCAGMLARIPEVMDCWFDSGMMPYAQFHYPFENETIGSDGRLPADYICEAVDQTRGWFYSLHALATLLNDDVAYRNVICLGLILDGRGRKMSKRLGNIVEPMPLLDAHGADALRWCLFTAAPAGEPRRFSDRLVQQTLRQVLLTLWNVYSFFTNYANIDEFEPSQIPAGWRPEAELDRWILSELNQLVQVVDGHLDRYNPTDAGRRIQEFIDILSNWYVRRSRRRFWKSENDADKLGAYATLYGCLSTLARLMAPLAPFVSEQMYRNLELPYRAGAPDSVHLADYPTADTSLIDPEIMNATQLAMRVVRMGRAARNKEKLTVRKPLKEAVVYTDSQEHKRYLPQFGEQIAEELNVKRFRVEGLSPFFDDEKIASFQPLADFQGSAISVKLDATTKHLNDIGYVCEVDTSRDFIVAVHKNPNQTLKDEWLAREMIHRISNLRRKSGFEITDRINILYEGSAYAVGLMQVHGDHIKAETLADSIREVENIHAIPFRQSELERLEIECLEVTLAVSRAAAGQSG